MNLLADFVPPLLSSIERQTSEIFGVEPLEDGLRVTTTCLYPSGGLVRVTIRGGRETVVISDEGEAFGEASASGIDVSEPERVARRFVGRRRLNVRCGSIYTDPLPIDEAAFGIAHVANVAKDFAHYLLEEGRAKRKLDFRASLKAFMMEKFRERLHEERLPGASLKTHRFSTVAHFRNERRLVVDTVSPDSSSINARVVAHMDLRANNDPRIAQRIIYDDAARWSAADLNVLKLGATIVPFSRAQDVIDRVARELDEAA